MVSCPLRSNVRTVQIVKVVETVEVARSRLTCPPSRLAQARRAGKPLPQENLEEELGKAQPRKSGQYIPSLFDHGRLTTDNGRSE